MPSVSEPFGLTPLEAAVYGTPSLISKQSGVAEIFRNCLRVDFWDINEMANQMLAAVTSEPLQQQLAEYAEAEASSLSWGRAADKVYDIYRQHLAPEAVPA
jgi:glycosyltransferase involved in cell wall biosynthesis